MSTPAFDPDRPLPDMPDPWVGTSVPAARSGPPYAMTEMIAAEPALAERVLAALGRQDGGASTLAGAIRDAAVAREPIVAVGCGTSEHGAMGFAEIVRDAMRAARLPGPGPVAAQALDAALDPQEGGLCIGISHEGGTAATIRAMEAARDAGARVALVTVTERSPAGAIAEVVLATRELDQSWCHTIGYLAPLLAGTAVAAALRGEDVGAARIRGLLAAGIEPAATSAAEATAGVLVGTEHIIVVGSGADRIAGRELTLKIEEAAWIPS